MRIVLYPRPHQSSPCLPESQLQSFERQDYTCAWTVPAPRQALGSGRAEPEPEPEPESEQEPELEPGTGRGLEAEAGAETGAGVIRPDLLTPWWR